MVYFGFNILCRKKRIYSSKTPFLEINMLCVKSFSVVVEYKATESSRKKRGITYGSAVSLFVISWQIFDSKLQRTCKLHHFSAPSPLLLPLAELSAASSRSCPHVRFGLWFRRHPSWTFHVLGSQFQVAKTKTVIISCILLCIYSYCFEPEWFTLRAVFPVVIPD
jgi:hypothetical protein